MSSRARICKRLRSPGTDSEESIPTPFVAMLETGPPGWESIPWLLKKFTNTRTLSCAPSSIGVCIILILRKSPRALHVTEDTIL
jgi:hypothetical protein